MAEPPLRLMNFITESELQEVRNSRSPRVEGGAVAVDKPLYEILKENKEKQEAEFNERFKHRPPKALDEEETEFLEQVETIRKEEERRLALEEAEQLTNFQVAIASRTLKIDGTKAPTSQIEEPKPSKKLKRPSQSMILANLIKVRPNVKKQKVDLVSVHTDSLDVKFSPKVDSPPEALDSKPDGDIGITGLVSYSDESGDDD